MTLLGGRQLLNDFPNTSCAFNIKASPWLYRTLKGSKTGWLEPLLKKARRPP